MSTAIWMKIHSSLSFFIGRLKDLQILTFRNVDLLIFKIEATELLEKKAIISEFACQALFRPLLLRTCPSGEIGRHRGFKIPRPQSVPVRVWPRAPF